MITDYTEYKNLNLQEIKALMADNPAIIDGRRIVNPKEADRLCFLHYGVGSVKQRKVKTEIYFLMEFCRSPCH